MSTNFTSLVAKGFRQKRLLPAAEWLAENAFIPPGAHRLLTAGGLTVGLWGGREFMDIIVARRSSDGTAITREQVPEIFRPLHGLLRYNAYSDEAPERWKSVVDKLSPMALGALGAWAGSKSYIYGRGLQGNPFHPGSRTVLDHLKLGKAPIASADAAANIAQGDAVRRLASPLFAIGSSAGTHLFGGLFPFTNSMSAQTFMQSIGRKLWIPGAKSLNTFFGNRGSGGKYAYAAMRDAAKWMEANIQQFDCAEHWATNEALRARAKDALQMFKHVTPAQEEKLASAMGKLIDAGYKQKASGNLYTFLTQGDGSAKAVGMFDVPFENLLKSADVDLSLVSLGDNGPFTLFSRLIGSQKAERSVWETYAKHLNEQHGYTLDPAAFALEKVKLSRLHAALAYGGAAATIGGGLAIGGTAANALNKRIDTMHSRTPDLAETLLGTEPDSDPATGQKKPHGGNLLDWLNGKPLDVMQWMSRVTINPPSMHRFMNAATLSVALYGGMKVTDALTGRKLQLIKSGGLANSVLEKKDVWAVLRPLHGMLNYTPGSAHFQDRWRQAAHFILPVIPGAFGTFMGSHLFFRDRIKSLENPKTLEDYADRISVEQSKFFAGATGLTSIFNTGSGIHLLPMFNYSSNLHNRYLLASGQQVAMPGLGKWWSGNVGLTPWGVKRSLQYLTNYLTYNDAPRPREMASLVHSIIGKLYPDMPQAELLNAKQTFMNRLYAVRDQYVHENHLMASKRNELHSIMTDMLSGKGFEEMLLESGLDPTKANLASNGVSGKLANFFTSGKTVEKLRDEYRENFAERLANHKPRTTAEILAEYAARDPAVNDNQHAPANDNAGQNFAERVASRRAEATTATPVIPG